MAYQSEAQLEQQLIEQLNEERYSSVNIWDYDALVANFRIQFQKFNAAKLDKPLSDKEWERVLNSKMNRLREMLTMWIILFLGHL